MYEFWRRERGKRRVVRLVHPKTLDNLKRKIYEDLLK
jgi:hypothetical protein